MQPCRHRPGCARETAALAAAYAAGRLPHALLIHEAPGAGGEWLAALGRAAGAVPSARRAPCGVCRGCRRVRARAAPGPQLGRARRRTRGRSASSRCASSPRSSRSPATAAATRSAMRHPGRCPEPLRRQRAAEDPRGAPAAHAPGPGRHAALAPAADRPQPLPAAARARPAARREPRVARARRGGAGDWAAALDTLGEAPFAGCRRRSGRGRRGRRARRAARSRRWPAATPTRSRPAERWARAELPLRLRCFENWLTERIRHGAAREAPL